MEPCPPGSGNPRHRGAEVRKLISTFSGLSTDAGRCIPPSTPSIHLNQMERKIEQLVGLEATSRLEIVWGETKETQNTYTQLANLMQRSYARVRDAFLRQQAQDEQDQLLFQQRCQKVVDEEDRERIVLFSRCDAAAAVVRKIFSQSVVRTLQNHDYIVRLRAKYFLKTLQIITQQEVKDRRGIIMAEQHATIMLRKTNDQDFLAVQQTTQQQHQHARMTMLHELTMQGSMDNKEKRRISPKPPVTPQQQSTAKRRFSAVVIAAQLDSYVTRASMFIVNKEDSSRRLISDDEIRSRAVVERTLRRVVGMWDNVDQEIETVGHITAARRATRGLEQCLRHERTLREGLAHSEDTLRKMMQRKERGEYVSVQRSDYVSVTNQAAHCQRIAKQVKKMANEVASFMTTHSHMETQLTHFGKEETSRESVTEYERSERTSLTHMKLECARETMCVCEHTRRTRVSLIEANDRDAHLTRFHLRQSELDYAAWVTSVPPDSTSSTMTRSTNPRVFVFDMHLRAFHREVSHIVVSLREDEERLRRMIWYERHYATHVLRAHAAQMAIIRRNRRWDLQHRAMHLVEQGQPPASRESYEVVLPDRIYTPIPSEVSSDRGFDDDEITDDCIAASPSPRHAWNVSALETVLASQDKRQTTPLLAYCLSLNRDTVPEAQRETNSGVPKQVETVGEKDDKKDKKWTSDKKKVASGKKGAGVKVVVDKKFADEKASKRQAAEKKAAVEKEAAAKKEAADKKAVDDKATADKKASDEKDAAAAKKKADDATAAKNKADDEAAIAAKKKADDAKKEAADKKTADDKAAVDKKVSDEKEAATTKEATDEKAADDKAAADKKASDEKDAASAADEATAAKNKADDEAAIVAKKNDGKKEATDENAADDKAAADKNEKEVADKKSVEESRRLAALNEAKAVKNSPPLGPSDSKLTVVVIGCRNLLASSGAGDPFLHISLLDPKCTQHFETRKFGNEVNPSLNETVVFRVDSARCLKIGILEYGGDTNSEEIEVAFDTMKRTEWYSLPGPRRGEVGIRLLPEIFRSESPEEKGRDEAPEVTEEPYVEQETRERIMYLLFTRINALRSEIRRIEEIGSPSDEDFRNADEKRDLMGVRKGEVADILEKVPTRIELPDDSVDALLVQLLEENDVNPNNARLLRMVLVKVQADMSLLRYSDALVQVCGDGNVRYMETILTHYRDIQVDESEVVPAACFSQTCRIPLVRCLLNHGYLKSSETGDVLQSFFESVSSSRGLIPNEVTEGRYELLDALLANVPSINVCDSILSNAARDGDVKLLEIILRHRPGLDVNRVQHDGTTALIQAVMAKQATFVEVFIRTCHNVDVAHTMPGTGTAFDIASVIMRSHPTIVELLRKATGEGRRAVIVHGVVQRASSRGMPEAQTDL